MSVCDSVLMRLLRMPIECGRNTEHNILHKLLKDVRIYFGWNLVSVVELLRVVEQRKHCVCVSVCVGSYPDSRTQVAVTPVRGLCCFNQSCIRIVAM